MLKFVPPLLLWLATAASAGPSVSPDSSMMFFPPGASSCGEFVKLEPMQKYDIEGTAFRKGDAEKYFAYRGIEEWVRGFFTAANIFHVQNGSGDITDGADLYKLMPRLFDYCRSHPDDLFSKAALHLMISLNENAAHQ